MEEALPPSLSSSSSLLHEVSEKLIMAIIAIVKNLKVIILIKLFHLCLSTHQVSAFVNSISLKWYLSKKKAWRVLPVTRSTAWGSGICPSSQERATHRNPRRSLSNIHTIIPNPHIIWGWSWLIVQTIDHPWTSTVALFYDWILKLPDFKRSRIKAHDKRFPINRGIHQLTHNLNPMSIAWLASRRRLFGAGVITLFLWFC